RNMASETDGSGKICAFPPAAAMVRTTSAGSNRVSKPGNEVTKLELEILPRRLGWYFLYHSYLRAGSGTRHFLFVDEQLHFLDLRSIRGFEYVYTEDLGRDRVEGPAKSATDASSLEYG